MGSQEEHETRDITEFCCSECGRCFKHVETLNVHLKYHSGDLPYTCVQCKFRFAIINHLLNHEKKHFDKSKAVSYDCDVCYKHFYSLDSLKCHLSDHCYEKQYKCLICNGRFAELTDLQTHLLCHVKKQDFVCKACNICFVGPDLLAYHMKSKHNSGITFVGETVKSSSNILNGRNTINKEAIVLDSKVLNQNSSNVEETMNSYSLNPSQTRSSIDSKVIKQSSTVDETNIPHNELCNENIPTKTTAKGNICHICGFVCVGTDILAYHLKTKHSVPFKSNCNVTTALHLEETTDKFLSKEDLIARSKGVSAQCAEGFEFYQSKCNTGSDETISNRRDISLNESTIGPNIHSTEDSTQSGNDFNLTGSIERTTINKPKQGCIEKSDTTSPSNIQSSPIHKCAKCTKTFATSDALKCHIQFHIIENNKICSECGESFNFFQELQNHTLDVHDLILKVNCPVCNKEYDHIDYLRTHMRLHTDEKPHECSICRQKFMFVSQLKKHKLKHSESVSCMCKICKKVFISVATVVEHLVKDHNEKCPSNKFEVISGVNEMLKVQALQEQFIHATNNNNTSNAECEFKSKGNLKVMLSDIKTGKNENCNQGKGSNTFQETSLKNLKSSSEENYSLLYMCNKCGQKYETRNKAAFHLRNHHKSKTTKNLISTLNVNIEEVETNRSPCGRKEEYNNRDQFNESKSLVSADLTLEKKQYVCINTNIAQTESNDGSYFSDSLNGYNEKCTLNSDSVDSYMNNESHICMNYESNAVNHVYNDDTITNSSCINKGELKFVEETIKLDQVMHNGNPVVEIVPEVTSEFHINYPEVSVKKTEMTNHQSGSNVIVEYQNNFADHVRYNEMEYCEVETEKQNYGTEASKQESEIVKFSCKECDANLSSAYALKLHTNIHKLENNKKCYKCQKSFITLNALWLHMYKFHGGPKQFDCEACDKTFTLFRSLKAHVRLHTGEKDYKCEICEKSYYTATALKTHLAVNHGGVNSWQCKLCGKVLNHPNAVRNHVREQHKMKSTKYMIVTVPKVTSPEDQIKETSIVQTSVEQTCEESDLSQKINEKFTKELDNSSTKENLIEISCGKCHKQFTSEETLAIHMKLHQIELNKICNYCNQKFEHFKDLEKHLSQAHPTVKPFKCEICQKAFPVFYNLKIHSRLHTGEKPYKCDVCDKPFCFSSSLKHHMLSHKNIKSWTCRLCHQKLSSYKHISSHIRKLHGMKSAREMIIIEEGDMENGDSSNTKEEDNHVFKDNDTNSVPVVELSHEVKNNVQISKVHRPSSTSKSICKECGNSFHSAELLKQHMFSHERSKATKCQTCDITFERLNLFERHMLEEHNIKKPYQCEECATCYKDLQGLRVHRRLHTGEKPYKCMVCDERFPFLASLKFHAFSHKKGNACLCKVCGKRFSTPNMIFKHLKKYHKLETTKNMWEVSSKYQETEDNGNTFNIFSNRAEVSSDCQQEYVCKICGYCTSTKELLDAHIKRHPPSQATSAKSLCKLCGKTFESTLAHKKHVSQEHSGLKAFSCSICSKNFKHLHSLKNHQRLHTGEKPFKCLVCHEKFHFESALHRHAFSHKVGTVFSCKKCGKKFKSCDNVTFHLKKYHKVKFVDNMYIIEVHEDVAQSPNVSTNSVNEGMLNKNVLCNNGNENLDLRDIHIADVKHHGFESITTVSGKYDNTSSISSIQEGKEAEIEFKKNVMSNICIDESNKEYSADIMSDSNNAEDEEYVTCEKTSGYIQNMLDLPEVQIINSCRQMEKNLQTCINKVSEKNEQYISTVDVEPNTQVYGNHLENGRNNLSLDKITDVQHLENGVYQQNMASTKDDCELNKIQIPTGKGSALKTEKPKHINLETSVIYNSNDTSSNENEEVRNPDSHLQNAISKSVYVSCDADEQLKFSQEEEENSMNSDKEEPKENTEVQTNKNLIKCTECDTCFVSFTDLKRHMDKYHDGMKPFGCNICGRRFVTLKNYNTHRRMHTGEKHIHCTICGQSFAAIAGLKNHLFSHMEKPSFDCTKCDRIFRTPCSLKSHLLLKHKVKSVKNQFELPPELQKCFIEGSSSNGAIMKENTDSSEDIVTKNNDSGSKELEVNKSIHDVGSYVRKQRKCKSTYKNTVSDISCSNKEMFNNNGKVNLQSNIDDIGTKILNDQANQGTKDHLRCKVCSECFTSQESLKLHIGIHEIEVSKACRICKQAFASYKGLENHCSFAHKVAPYQCPICNGDFTCHINIINHLMIHKGIKPYECKECGKSFRFKVLLKRHLAKHKGQLPKFGCKLCDKAFIIKSGLVYHMNKAHGMSKYKCTTCEKQFKFWRELSKHMKDSHPVINNPKCNICGKNFSSKTNLKYHLRSHTGELPYECKICGKRLRYHASMDYHMKSHSDKKPYMCSVCGKSFKVATLLYSHKFVHAKKTHKCQKCGKMYKAKSALVQHMKTHSTTEKLFPCSLCDKVYKSSTTLNIHDDTVHKGLRPWSCKVCSVHFAQKGHLVAHMLVHTGIRPYECEVCHISFARPGTLKRHMRRHTGEKPYCCNECGKRFSLKCVFVTHLRIHTGERPYVCEVCGKGFIDRSGIRQHRKQHLNRKT